jgi:hypothetical protein
MLIQYEPFKHWMNHFYGFGSWEAKFWFVGYEEGGGDLPEEVAEKLTYFSQTHPSAKTPTLCDIRELYKQVVFRAEGPRAEQFVNRYEYRFGPEAIKHGVWKNLIAFVHGYRNEPLPDLLEYQKNLFAKDNEALIQLYPLPSPHNHAWYYSWLDMPQMPFLKSRAQYESHLYKGRIDSIINKLIAHKPEVVLMYGMNNINLLKESIHEYFPSAKFKMMKAVKGQLPQYHRADLHGTLLLITTQIPALRHNRIETGFDWEKLGRTIKNGE